MDFKIKILSACISIALLSGCGGKDKNTAPISKDVVIDVKQSVTITDMLDGSDQEGNVTFSIVDPKSVKLGKLVITDAEKGIFTYTTDEIEGTEIVPFKVSDGENESISELTIRIHGGDPLFTQQWHLKNTGQAAFSLSDGIAGYDMNVSNAISKGITGKGVTVAVIDNGVEISHPDLKNNVVPGGSLNLITGTIDPTPFSKDAAHGTAVAGIIAAEGWNGIGGRGVAPEATLIGFNFLDSNPACDLPQNAKTPACVSGTQTFTNFAKAHGESSYSKVARVFNQSSGSNRPFPVSLNTNENENEVLAGVTKNSHDGLGSLFVKSAGNEFTTYTIEGKPVAPSLKVLLGSPGNHGLPFHNANMSADNTNFYNLVVSAINAKGVHASYSSVGANIFVTAPGGEFGTDTPAIVTTDRASCNNGFSKFNDKPSTPFDGGKHPLNLECDYTSTMNGTSSAAPNTSGAIAMIMSANPSLNWRDVRNILAKTARKIDANIKPITIAINTNKASPKFEAMSGWITNAAGFNFHDFYGFGLIDVSKAVEEAQNYEDDLGEYIVTDWNKKEHIESPIPDGDLTGVTDKILVEENLIIEGVQITLTAEHGRLPDLAVELISPSGTKSMLITPYNGFVFQGIGIDDISGYKNTPMLSNAFFGEPTLGEWKLKVTDVNSGEYSFFTTYKQGTVDNPTGEIKISNEANGKLKGWSIRFHGHSAT